METASVREPAGTSSGRSRSRPRLRCDGEPARPPSAERPAVLRAARRGRPRPLSCADGVGEHVDRHRAEPDDEARLVEPERPRLRCGDREQSDAGAEQGRRREDEHRRDEDAHQRSRRALADVLGAAACSSGRSGSRWSRASGRPGRAGASRRRCGRRGAGRSQGIVAPSTASSTSRTHPDERGEPPVALAPPVRPRSACARMTSHLSWTRSTADERLMSRLSSAAHLLRAT